ncbi:MAG: acetylglutamate kinase [Termitinemataceae bacterium]|nr:MAG: acetylglutamate kinase [Termitinemataceae bacterium]
MQNETLSMQLIDALPHIRALRTKTLVVKYGGNAMINDELKNAVIADIVFMAAVGIKTVVVHGGGPEIDAMLKAVGKESRFIDGLRYTDEETMEIVQMVLCGKVNKNICALIQEAGAQALGLCGIDGALLQAERVTEKDLGLVGNIVNVNSDVLKTILASGAIPVISPVAVGIGSQAANGHLANGDQGKTLNVNADIAAAKIAAALCAEKLILITDVRGILRDVHNPQSLISVASRQELAALKKEGILRGGMIPKTDCCTMALDGGVKNAHIIDGRIPHSLLTELFTAQGIGTLIKP